MRQSLLLLCALGATLGTSAQQTYMKCDFAAGIPDTFTLFDQDMNEPSIDMKEFGFAAGTPWLAVEEGTEGNMAACSTSWYRVPGTSDDWMVSPEINVASAEAVIRWHAKAGDKEYRDGYKVYVSASAATPDEFKALEPAMTVKNEKSEWTTRQVSLADYVGQTVRVAWVNNSTDCSTLYLDDIFAGIPSALELTGGLPRVVVAPGALTVSGSVANTTTTDINGFDITYVVGKDGDTYVEHVAKTVKAGKSCEFSFVSEATIEAFETLPYEIIVEHGNDFSSCQGIVSCYPRRIVAEEMTGVWCGYCVRGIVAMRNMKALYPDQFFGIAVHGSASSWEDPMDMHDYTDWLFSKLAMKGYPHATVNRLIACTGDPANIKYFFEQQIKKDSWFGIDLSADIDPDSRTIQTHTTVYAARDYADADFRLAYVVVENDVHSDEVFYDEQGNAMQYNGWEQENYYAGGAMGQMDGFEDMPEVIPGSQMWFQDVARYISDDYTGVADSKFTAIKEGETYEYDYTVTLPDNIRDDHNCELAVMLVNNKSGEIVNADVVSLDPYFTNITQNAAQELRIVRNGDVMAAPSADSLIVYAIDGSMAAQGVDNVDVAGLHGIYIVVATAEGRTVTQKIAL